jgi:hypothetical protein
LHVSSTLDGNVAVDGVLDPVGGAIVTGELDRLITDQRRADADAGVERSLPELRAAALVEMARRCATATGASARPLFTVLVGDDSFRHMCELSNGTVISPRQLAGWLTDAVIETVLFNGPSTVVSVSRRRSFTGALRRAVEVRDRHCQHPSGCDEPVDRCDVDHIVPFSRGGATSQFNGRLECAVHNRNPARHDHGAIPPPEQAITTLDELRARVRWRVLNDHPEPLLDTG